MRFRSRSCAIIAANRFWSFHSDIASLLRRRQCDNPRLNLEPHHEDALADLAAVEPHVVALLYRVDAVAARAIVQRQADAVETADRRPVRLDAPGREFRQDVRAEARPGAVHPIVSGVWFVLAT